MSQPKSWASALLRLSVWLGPFCLCGCGNPGSPLPPSLMLPQPVSDLRAARTGDAVTLDWTMPRRTIDRIPLQGDQRAVICRSVEGGPCEPHGVLLLEAGKPAQFQDFLPPELRSGSTRLLRYEVHLPNHRRRDAGVSNPAFEASGPAPPPIRSVSAEATPRGILVHWTAPLSTAAPALPPGTRLLVRIERNRVPQASERPTAARDREQPIQQVLEAPQHSPAPGAQSWSPDHTLDADAQLNRSYRYTAQLVAQLAVEGHALEMRGAEAQTAVIDAKDLFPPAAPGNLAAVANADSGTIDLSWAPSTELDASGYFLYRRVAGGETTPERVSGNNPVKTPNWTDKTAKPGVRYAYSVSAVDSSGNESARSAEAAEALH